MIRWAKVVAINLVLTAVLVALIEGGSSYLRFLWRAAGAASIAEQRHTEFDPEIGWVNLPNVRIEGMYGPGTTLTTNSQRFRANRDYSVETPRDKFRIFCAGDSFTLGYGVGDDEAWCRQLELMDSRLETVNLGQGGYGVDQAYLWYEKNKSELQHNALVFAFVTLDFARAARDHFQGFSKPYLTIDDGRLIADNTPLARTSFLSRATANAAVRLDDLLTTRLLQTIVRRMGWGGSDAGTNEATRAMAATLFADLDRTQEANGRRLILLYLPTEGDFIRPHSSDEWREFVAREAKEQGYLLIDLVGAMQASPARIAKEMFQGPPNLHLTDAGNEFVAREVLARLEEEQIVPPVDAE